MKSMKNPEVNVETDFRKSDNKQFLGLHFLVSYD
jgi:hypothetical protein